MNARGAAPAIMGLALAASGCAFMQPSSTKAPIADTVGAGLFTAVAVGAAAGDPNNDNNGRGAAELCLAVAAVYALSAIYGFTRDPKTQNSDDPILGLQILALGLAGFGNASSSRNQQGCCSHHGGVGGYCDGDGMVVCADGESSPTCRCDR